MTTRTELPRLLALLGVGVLVFAAGLVWAQARIPEWQAGPLPAAESFTGRLQTIAQGMSLRLAPGGPKITLATGGEPKLPSCQYQLRSSPVVAALCSELRVILRQHGALPDERRGRELEVGYALSGEPRFLMRSATADVLVPTRGPAEHASVDPLVRGLLEPGEQVDAPRQLNYGGVVPLLIYGVSGSILPCHVTVLAVQGRLSVERLPGTPENAVAKLQKTNLLLPEILSNVRPVLRSVLVLVMFMVLLARRSIDFVNGTLAGLAILAAGSPAALGAGSALGVAGALFVVAGRAVWIWLTWSTGESLLRSSDPEFTTSLDALRVGRLGPRGGRALLLGLALGAAVAGLRLAVHAAALSRPALWPLEATLRLPVFSRDHTPFGDGILLAALIVLLLGIARRVVSPRWIALFVIVAGAVIAGPVQIHPYGVELAANALLLSPLVLLARRSGLMALLTASVTLFLLPVAVFSGLHRDWLPGTFAATAVPMASLLVLGFVGLARSSRVEHERLRAPRFIRRLEEERRLKYEMDLLARMQEGLLPPPPEIPGWQIAARSILANEAGGDLYDFLTDDEGKLWVAVGDVAGHGYSCAIVQAMTSAALTSLISPERTPAEVLWKVDRVIRRGGAGRHFTSLTLLRLDPATGDVVISNAGHPFPLQIAGGGSEVHELALPGLPLGQGPPRQYEDHAFQLPPGGALVFYSDGLAEAPGREDVQYGFDRPREHLRSVADGSAQAMLEALLADWREHLDGAEPSDDTTVVVVKRELHRLGK